MGEERRLRVFESRIKRSIFGPKKDVNWEWIRLYNSLYRSPNIVRVIMSRRLRWAKMEDCRNAFKILTATPKGNIPLRRPRRRWEDNIRMDLEEIGINTRIWVDSTRNRNYWRVLVNAALNLRVP